MKKIIGVTLGILTAVGGFVDIGDLVANALVGARYGMALAWVVVVGVIGIMVYGEMSARVAAVTHRATFDLIRERLGPRFGLVNLGASFLVNILTLCAEIGGVALALQLASSVNYLLWVPLVAFLVWFVMWRVKFDTLEQVFGLGGLALIAFGVALWKLGPDWAGLLHQALKPTVPSGEGHPTYFYYAIALFGSAMTPYEVFFLSSGGVEEKWTTKDLVLARANSAIGFPLGALIALAIMAVAAVVLYPAGISVDALSQTVLPGVIALGKLGLAFLIIGIFCATFGAALETGLSSGYTIGQYFGWQWGKYVRPREAARFHLVLVVSVLAGAMVLLTTVDPIKVTEYSLVFSAVALPLTYFPVLLIANDHDYMGEKTNGRFTNALALIYLVILIVVSVAAIPLMIATKAGL
ncbi:MAG: divalent metal cation transporter [Actinomycetota bacterium]|nr:divalent metal cation transporter [Actinomycetota bacterium]